jgi:UDP-N-acetylmuramate-alanine ligase
MQENDPPKFNYYDPKYLVITSTRWDHPEIYKSQEEYTNIYLNLVKKIPADGIVVYNIENVYPKIIKEIKCKKISYSLNNNHADYYISEINKLDNQTELTIRGKNILKITTSLFGDHNFENICASVSLLLEIGINKEELIKPFSSFLGIKTRLEYVGEYSDKKIYWDFAQHPLKIKEAIKSLKEKYPNSRLWCIFDPTMTGLKYKESLAWYKDSFLLADKVLVLKNQVLKRISKNDRVTGSDIVKSISLGTKAEVSYEPLEENVIHILKTETKKNDILLFLSPGSLLTESIINNLKI